MTNAMEEVGHVTVHRHVAIELGDFGVQLLAFTFIRGDLFKDPAGQAA